MVYWPALVAVGKLPAAARGNEKYDPSGIRCPSKKVCEFKFNCLRMQHTEIQCSNSQFFNLCSGEVAVSPGERRCTEG